MNFLFILRLLAFLLDLFYFFLIWAYFFTLGWSTLWICYQIYQLDAHVNNVFFTANHGILFFSLLFISILFLVLEVFFLHLLLFFLEDVSKFKKFW